MAVSVQTLAIGTQIPSSESTLTLGVSRYYHYQTTTEVYPGTHLVGNGSWTTSRNMYVQNGGTWREVKQSDIVADGQWKPTASFVYRVVTRRTTRVRMFGGRYGEPDGFSMFKFTLPNDLYVPESWPMVKYHTYGIYDDICDGTFFGASTALYPQARAMIMSKRPTSTWVGVDTGTWQTWQTWSGTVTNLSQNQSGNWTCPTVRTADVPPRSPCNCDRCTDHIIPYTFVTPFNINQWVSIKRGGDCSTCNHGAYLNTATFEEPNSEVITYS